MRTLSRYLLADFLVASLVVLLALLVTWLAGDSLRHLDAFGRDRTLGLWRVAGGVLDAIPYGVPIACLAGAVWTLSRAVRNREIVAIRAGGIPLRRALAPLLLGSLGVAIALGFFEDRIANPARFAMARAIEERDAGDGHRPREIAGRFWHASAGAVFSAGAYDRDSRTLSDVTVFRFDPGGAFRERIDAGTVVNIERDVWEFRDLRVREFRRSGDVEKRRPGGLRLDLGLSGADLEKLRRPARLRPLSDLYRELGDPAGPPREAAALATVFHSRALEPLAVVALVLFAIPLALGAAERGESLPRALLLSVAWAAGYWLAWALALQVSQRGSLPPFLPLWGVALGALALGLERYRRLRE